jgi:hypothetical protein
VTLRLVDRAADGRARIYAQELRQLIAFACLSGTAAVPVESLQELADRMDGCIPAPASLDAWRIKKEDGQ